MMLYYTTPENENLMSKKSLWILTDLHFQRITFHYIFLLYFNISNEYIKLITIIHMKITFFFKEKYLITSLPPISRKHYSYQSLLATFLSKSRDHSPQRPPTGSPQAPQVSPGHSVVTFHIGIDCMFTSRCLQGMDRDSPVRQEQVIVPSHLTIVTVWPFQGDGDALPDHLTSHITSLPYWEFILNPMSVRLSVRPPNSLLGLASERSVNLIQPIFIPLVL